MTDLFILLAAVTVICTGAAIPCFFKSSRNTAGFLILTVAVIAAAAACFVTPLKACFASLAMFDLWYYIGLFAAAFIISLFFRPLLGIALILYALWCALFLIILLPAGYSPSASVGEITVSSPSDTMYTLEKVTMSPYQLLPFKKNWYKSSEKNVDAVLGEKALKILGFTGAIPSSEKIVLPESATYPHIYLLLMEADGSSSFETVF